MARTLDDEPALYPPDVEQLTPELQEQRRRAVIGTFLVSLGAGVLLERAFSTNLEIFWLSVGLALLAGWLQVPRYPAFVLGSIITGFGLEDFVESAVHLRFESTIGALIVAAGFFAVYVRYPSRAKWALLPAAFMAIYAVADFGVGLIGLVPGSIGLLPVALISGGAILLFRERLPRRFVVIGLIAAATLFVCSASSSVGDLDAGALRSLGGRKHTFYPPLVEGALVITTATGDVTIQTDPDATAAEVTTTVDRKTAPGSILTVDDIPPTSDVDVRLPPGTNLVVTTKTGDIDVEYDAAESRTGNITLTTKTGNVTLDGGGRLRDIGPALTLASTTGDIDVGDDEFEGSYERPAKRENTRFQIGVSTRTGDIELEDV